MISIAFIVGLVAGLLVGLCLGAILIERHRLLNHEHLDKLLVGLDNTIKKFDSPDYYSYPLHLITRRMRNLGWFRTVFPKFLTTVPILSKHGISSGEILEIGQGAGYLGLELVSMSHGKVSLTCLDVSTEMLRIARNNAKDCGEDVKHVGGDVHHLPFKDDSFDGVFSNASLHEWLQPKIAISEMLRVLKPGGRYCIADLRRDTSKLTRFIVTHISPRWIRPAFEESFQSSYTLDEARVIAQNSKVIKTYYGLIISGCKGG